MSDDPTAYAPGPTARDVAEIYQEICEAVEARRDVPIIEGVVAAAKGHPNLAVAMQTSFAGESAPSTERLNDFSLKLGEFQHGILVLHKQEDNGVRSALIAAEMAKRFGDSMTIATVDGGWDRKAQKHVYSLATVYMQPSAQCEQRDHSAMLSLYDSGDIQEFLRQAVLRRYNLLLCGATGSGKTAS